MSAAQVAIVIPTYNHAHFLRAALDSVLAQTYQNWEALVINNHSEDETLEVVATYTDPRIRCVDFANHGIIAASRNHGMTHTDAPFIAFLDSDDVWHPQKLQKCLAHMEEGFDLICHAETWVGPGKRRREVIYGPESRATYDALLYEGNCISTSAVLVKRSVVDKTLGFSTDPNFVTAEDYEFWMQLVRAGARVGFVRETLGEYLIHDGNQSRTALRNMHAVAAVVGHHLALQPRATLPQRLRIRRRQALIYYSGARSLQDCGDFRAAWPYFFKALSQYPLLPKFYAAMALNACGRTR